MPTHYCTVCGALWELLELYFEGGWSLRSPKCGSCCDNVEMDAQIKRLTEEQVANYKALNGSG